MPDAPEAPQALRGLDVFKLHKLIGKVSAVASQANTSNFLGSHPANENHVGPHGSLGSSPLYMGQCKLLVSILQGLIPVLVCDFVQASLGRLELVDKGSAFASQANASILVSSLPTN